MFENIKSVVMFTLWMISWGFLIIGTGFFVKLLSYLFMFGWNLI